MTVILVEVARFASASFRTFASTSLGLSEHSQSARERERGLRAREAEVRGAGGTEVGEMPGASAQE